MHMGKTVCTSSVITKSRNTQGVAQSRDALNVSCHWHKQENLTARDRRTLYVWRRSYRCVQGQRPAPCVQ